MTNFEVRIRIEPSSYADLISPNKPYPFRPGMSASVDIYTRREEGAVSLPIQAVTTREPKDDDANPNNNDNKDLLEVVFVIAEDSVKMVQVVTGLQDDEFIQIKSGIEAGAQVVIGPYSAVARELEQGTQIYIVTEEEYYEEDNN